MITSIKKLFTSFFAKVFVGIIILPFIFWGMGDVFRTGYQNVLLTINSEKVSTSEFANYLNRLNLDENQRRDLKKKDTLKAKEYYEKLFENGNPYSFAYLAGEADFMRIYK